MVHSLNNKTPILPIPKNADKEAIKIDGTKPSLYPYRNLRGEILFYIGVVYGSGRKKTVRPICWARDINGQEGWSFKNPLEDSRPLLNLPNLRNGFEKIIIVGEGEKTAEALKKLFPDFIATTSCGGAKAAYKTDWSVLCERDVVLSLDSDDAGDAYGRDVYKLCQQAGVRSIKIIPTLIFGQYAIRDDQVIELKRELPQGYDLADAFDEGWRSDSIHQLNKALEKKGEPLLVEVETVFGGINNDGDFPDLKPIKQELLSVDPLPLSIIPDPLQPWLQDISYRMQCPLEHVAIPAMVMLGSLIGTGCGIRPKQKDNWLVVPNLWGGIIGNPGTLKSPAMEEALKPLKQLESEARKQFEEEQEEYEVDLEAHKITKEACVSDIKKCIKNNKTLPIDVHDIKDQLKKIEEPKEPVCQRFKTNDVTIEQMVVLLQNNPRGLLLFRDELMGLLTKWDKPGYEPDRAFFLEAWNGYGSHTTDRIGRGTTHCDNMCVSLLGGTQPSKILSYLHKTINSIENDGLIQRFQLLVYPDELLNWQNIDQISNSEAQINVFQIAKAIVSIDFQQHGVVKEEDEIIPYFHFSEEAQKLFNEWLTDLETTKLRGGEEPIIVEHLSKYRSLMPSLSLIFHIIDVASGQATGLVSLQAAEKAAAWCDFLEQHARRIYGMVTHVAPHLAKELSGRLEDGELEDGFTVRDIYRKGWHLLNNKESVQLACDDLVKLGWLKEKVIEAGQGQKSTTKYLINPKIKR